MSNSQLPAYTFGKYTTKQLLEIAKIMNDTEKEMEEKTIGRQIRKEAEVKDITDRSHAFLNTKFQEKDAQGHIVESGMSVGDAIKAVTQLKQVQDKLGSIENKLSVPQIQAAPQLMLPAATETAGTSTESPQIEEVVDDTQTEATAPSSSDVLPLKILEVNAHEPVKSMRTYDVKFSVDGNKVETITVSVKPSDYGSRIHEVQSRVKDRLLAGPNISGMLDKASAVNIVTGAVIWNIVKYLKLPLPMKLDNGSGFGWDLQENGPYNVEPQKGHGLKTPKKPYKGHSKSTKGQPLTVQIISDTKAQFGNKFIDIIPLTLHKRLTIKDAQGRTHIDESVSEAVVNLLTKRVATATKYKTFSEQDLKTFVKIMRVCDVVPSATEKKTAKYKLLSPYMQSPDKVENAVSTLLSEGLNLSNDDDLATYVERGIKAIQGGNTNEFLIKRVIDHSGMLMKRDLIDKETYDNIMDEIRGATKLSRTMSQQE